MYIAHNQPGDRGQQHLEKERDYFCCFSSSDMTQLQQEIHLIAEGSKPHELQFGDGKKRGGVFRDLVTHKNCKVAQGMVGTYIY